MWLQLFLFLLAFIVWQKYESNGGNSKAIRHKYVNFLIVILFLQSALRHEAVGLDTYSYIKDFEITRDVRDWNWVWQNFYDVYVLGEGKDAGFHLLMKSFSTLCPYSRIWLFFVAILFFIPFCRLAEKELRSLKQLFMFFCVYQTMYYSFFSITGIRQTIATVATLYGIKFIRQNKPIQFVFWILLAAFIHKSVLLFLPFYIIAKLSKSKCMLISVMTLLPVIFGLGRKFAFFMSDFAGGDQYLQYAESDMKAGATKFLIFIMLGAILTLISKMRKPDSMPDIWVFAVSLTLLFTPLAWVDTSLMRVIQYFALFSMISIPLSIDNLGLSKKVQNNVYWIFFAALLITTIRHDYGYCFFWQDMVLGSNYK